jgi:hypothetical protein
MGTFMTQTLGHAQMQYDAPLTQAQGQAILQKLDQILALLKRQDEPTVPIEQRSEQPIIPVTAPDKTGFDLFWSTFPRKIGKGAAELAWKKLKPDSTLQARIIQAVKAQCKSEQWRRDQGQFIPHPATWLNGKRWEDEVEVKIAQDKPPVMYKTLPPRPDGEACPPEAKAILSKFLGKDFSL